MVDISFPPEIMLQVWEHYGDNFIFIDHHVSSIESSIQNKVINSQKNPNQCLSDYKKGCRI